MLSLLPRAFTPQVNPAWEHKEQVKAEGLPAPTPVVPEEPTPAPATKTVLGGSSRSAGQPAPSTSVHSLLMGMLGVQTVSVRPPPSKVSRRSGPGAASVLASREDHPEPHQPFLSPTSISALSRMLWWGEGGGDPGVGLQTGKT